MKQKHTLPGATRRRPRTASVILTVILACLLISNMAVIFLFSAANGAESGKTSAGVTRFLLETFYAPYDDLPSAEQETILHSTHKFVRKAAHFCEFALLGFLSAGLLLWVSARKRAMKAWKTWVYPAAFTLLYAISDEVHQMFTDRGPRVTDVLIDFAGACFGILLIHGLAWLVTRRRKGKHRSKEGRDTSCETPATN